MLYCVRHFHGKLLIIKIFNCYFTILSKNSQLTTKIYEYSNVTRGDGEGRRVIGVSLYLLNSTTICTLLFFPIQGFGQYESSLKSLSFLILLLHKLVL